MMDMIVAYYMLKQAEAKSKVDTKIPDKSSLQYLKIFPSTEPVKLKSLQCHRCGQYPIWCTCDTVFTIHE